MLGVFGLVVAALGFALSEPLTVVGVFIVLAAALWSVAAYSAARKDA
jgi:hypothetical protein